MEGQGMDKRERKFALVQVFAEPFLSTAFRGLEVLVIVSDLELYADQANEVLMSSWRWICDDMSQVHALALFASGSRANNQNRPPVFFVTISRYSPSEEQIP
jgi:hypothetical protein